MKGKSDIYNRNRKYESFYPDSNSVSFMTFCMVTTKSLTLHNKLKTQSSP